MTFIRSLLKLTPVMNNMKTSAYFVMTYAILVALGGFIGWFIAGSVPSLVTGFVFGSLIFLNSIRMLKGNLKGQQLAMIQAIVLGSFFVYRYQSTGKAMPAIPMIAMSFLLAAFLLFRMPKKAQN